MRFNINKDEFHDRILGCWMGKNIGGTLGAPFEGTHEMPKIDFYTQELNGDPLPNDDLDLQMIWLYAAEQNGVYRLTPRIMAEYWLNFEIAPMGEYGKCLANIVNGFYPPLSGSCNNDKWKWSNGAWIRSEIWACFFPGSPDEAARCAYIDACADHEGEGIWAEVFTASLQSAAFVEHDVNRLLEIALDRVAPESRVASSVRRAISLFNDGVDFVTAREEIVKHNEETGFFQAPQNIGFVVLALLYGRGDFEETILNAVRCGDDTDCTAATAGATLGIILGRKQLPEKWCKPIGDRIVTLCLPGYGMKIPHDLEELTRRTIAVACRNLADNPGLIDISDAPTCLDGFKIPSGRQVREKIAKRSPYEVMCDVTFARIGAVLENGPDISTGEPLHIRFILHSVSKIITSTVKIELMLPEDWRCEPGRTLLVSGTNTGPQCGEIDVTVIPGEIPDALYFMPVKISLTNRAMPEVRMIPLQKKGCVDSRILVRNNDTTDRFTRLMGREIRYPSVEFDF